MLDITDDFHLKFKMKNIEELDQLRKHGETHVHWPIEQAQQILLENYSLHRQLDRIQHYYAKAAGFSLNTGPTMLPAPAKKDPES